MLNKYFDPYVDKDFIYANSALANINCALVSLDYILNDYLHYEHDIGIYHDEHTYYFYHIQVLLTACGNINNIFYNCSKYGNTAITERCSRLRRRFEITEAPYKLIFQKEARNTSVHFDERYDEVYGDLGDYNLLDKSIDIEMRETILNKHNLRAYDKENHIYYTYGRKRNRISYDFDELRAELYAMQKKILNNPITNSAWINQHPNDILE